MGRALRTRRSVRNPRPQYRLSRGFLAANGRPVGLWLPTPGLGPKAYDFNGLIFNNGTLNGGITTSGDGVGVLGQSWKFDGSTGYIASTYLGITGTAARWCAVAFKTTSITGAGTNPVISWGDNTGLVDGGIWDVHIETGVIWLRAGHGVTANFGSGYNNGKWHLLVLTMKSGALCNEVECSVDGVPLSGTFTSGTNAINTSSVAAVKIGRTTTNNNNFLGSVAMAAIGSSYMPVSSRASLYSSLLYGSPYRLFAPRGYSRFTGASAAVAGKVPWQLFQSRCA